MASLYAHGKSFVSRLTWLSPLMGGIFPTTKYLFRARGEPMEIGRLVYNGAELEFRNCDSTAVKEVLVDEEYHFLSAFLQSSPEPFIIDVGAHIGTFSLWAYHQNPKVRMLRVEANPESCKILVSNIRKIFSEGQYEILNKAAWRSADPLTFSTTGDSMGNKVSSDGDIEVSGITFADIVKTASSNSTSIDLMKIDIEGAEEAFFETEDSELDKVKRLVIELHPKSCDTQAVRKKLEQRYKNIQEIPGRIDSKPVLYCTDDF